MKVHVLVLFLVMGSGHAAMANSADEDAQMASVEAAWRAQGNVNEQLKALEKSAISKSLGSAHRQSRNLVLKLSEAPAIKLSDSCEKDGCEAYYFLAALPTRHSYLVAHGYFETIDILLFDDRAGEKISMASIPHFSPDSQKLVAVHCDIGDETHDNVVEIFHHEGTRFLSEWSLHFADVSKNLNFPECEFVSWLPNAIAVDFWSGDIGHGAGPRSHAQIVSDKSGWSLKVNWPAQK